MFFSSSSGLASGTSSKENYVVMIQNPLHLSFLVHEKCQNQTTKSSLRFGPYIENALYVMSIYSDGNVRFQSIYATVNGQEGVISTSSTPECPHVPSILIPNGQKEEHGNWVIMNNRNPVQPQYMLEWTAGEQMGYLDCKLMGSDQQYIAVDKDDIYLTKSLDMVSTIRIVRPNMDYATPSNALLGMVQCNNLYLNHISKVPSLSEVPVSAIWTFYMDSINQVGFQELSFQIQSHVKSEPTYFPSWYLEWDLNSGFAMTQNSNPMTTTWTLQVTSRVFQTDGMKIYGYLKHNGYYVCKNTDDKNTFTTSLTKPSSSECFGMTLFNHVFL